MTSSGSSTPAHLVLDASTKAICVGIVTPARWLAFRQATGDALETLFRLTDKVLSESHLNLPNLHGVYFCSGPGSLLGLRLAAMAISTWRALPDLAHWELRQYYSLEFIAATRLLAGEADFHVLSPLRRDQVNHLRVAAGKPEALGVLPIEELGSLTGARYFVPNGTLRTSPPSDVTLLDYSLHSLPEVQRAFPDYFRSVAQPDAHVPIAPQFARWSADRHRGPTIPERRR